MADFSQSLVFTAADQTEYDAMKTWVNGAGAASLANYTKTWDDANRKLTLATAGTRSTDWSNG
jgi:hypothetical protein